MLQARVHGFKPGVSVFELSTHGAFTLSDIKRDGNNILWVETEGQDVRLKGYTEFRADVAPQINILFRIWTN